MNLNYQTLILRHEILEELKQEKNNDNEDLFYRMHPKYHEFIDILDLKYVPTKKNRLFPKSKYL